MEMKDRGAGRVREEENEWFLIKKKQIQKGISNSGNPPTAPSAFPLNGVESTRIISYLWLTSTR